MKFLITLPVAFLCIILSGKSVANEEIIKQKSYNNIELDLVTNSSPVSQLILTQDLNTLPTDTFKNYEAPKKIVGEFNTRLLSVEAGVIESKQESNWSKYYFQGALVLHQHDEFNVSLMANIEQINSFYHHNELSLTLDNSIIINETEVNYSYGIVGSYSISPSWKFSGGVIHAQPLNEQKQNTWYGDANMALIGTTYSF